MLQQRQAQGAKKTNMNRPGTGPGVYVPGEQHSILKGECKKQGVQVFGVTNQQVNEWDTANKEHRQEGIAQAHAQLMGVFSGRDVSLREGSSSEASSLPVPFSLLQPLKMFTLNRGIDRGAETERDLGLASWALEGTSGLFLGYFSDLTPFGLPTFILGLDWSQPCQFYSWVVLPCS